MEAFGLLGFIFGAYAFVRIEKLEKKLKDTGILDKDFTSKK
ncbi:hypothetical protein ACFL47_08730 [Candidatus Latescibacterota bacterium]